MSVIDDKPSSALTTETTPAEEQNRFLALFPSVMLPMFMAVADQTVVAAALPAIANTLGGIERVSWIVIAYLVATTVAAPVYGQMRDMLGSRSMMMLALVIFMAASVLCAVSTSLEMLAFARVLQGLGGGGLMTLSQALIGESVAPRERARYQGWLAAVAVTASTAGPILGGLLTQHVGWRSIFLVNLPLGLVALLLVARLKSQPFVPGSWRLDGWGIVYFTLFIVPVLLGLELFHTLSAKAALIALMLIGLGIVSLIVLLRHEERTEAPLLRLELLRRDAIWRSNMIVACHGAALVSLVTWLPIYFRVRFGSDAAEAGALLLPLMFGLGAGSMITGQLVGRTGLTLIFPTVGLAVTIVLMQILALFAGRLGVGQLLFLLGAIGLFMGTVMSVMQLTVQRAAGSSLLGAAAASVQFSRSVGAAVGTAMVGSVLFATLATSDAATGAMFRSLLVDPDALDGLASFQQVALRSGLSHVFSVTFFSITLFVGISLAMAWTHPERRL